VTGTEKHCCGNENYRSFFIVCATGGDIKRHHSRIKSKKRKDNKVKTMQKKDMKN